MKAFFITTETTETHKHHESFMSLGNEVQCYIYRPRRKGVPQSAEGAALDAEIYAAAKAYAPDIIVYVGAAGGNIPSAAVFTKLRTEIAPTVHLCSDAADDPWWPYLVEYDKLQSFVVQVALDGNKAWPLASMQITALTTLDHKQFPATPRPHAERSIAFGFAGNFSAHWIRDAAAPTRREEFIEQMGKFGLQTRKRDARQDSYPEFVAYLCDCRIVPNFSRTGTQRFMHVKGRVVETALAGAMLLEQRGSPTADWFEPGVDYLEYGDVDEARGIVEHYASRPQETQAFGARLRAKLLAEHRPEQFWARIFDRIGLSVTA